MRRTVVPRRFEGSVRVPASKSHTIRRLLVASLANGVSEIEGPLDSLDARSCVSVCRGLGAEIGEYREDDPEPPCPNPPGHGKLIKWTVRGAPGLPGRDGARVLDAGNSGTTLYLALAAAALGREPFTFTGDGQLRRRSAAPLLDALSGLGVRVESRNGCAPVTVQGPWKGGRVSLPCPTSQYLSALLLASPLAPAGTVTEISVPLLNEKPYIEMTLSYLEAQKIPYEKAGDFSFFRIPGGSSYGPLPGPVPADFSSAAFPAAAAAVSGGRAALLGLDPEDTQGDKVFFDMLARMGCRVTWEHSGLAVSCPGKLRGGVFDLNAAPDTLPALAAVAAFAEGDTVLANVAHARIKETDRIAVMAAELGKLGITCAERPDGLVIHGNPRLRSGAEERPRPSPVSLDGRGDHRVVMALAAAALAAGPACIEGAEAADVTYPGFWDLFA
ncbi:MAG: 3-phosphoshikimate 1-carboxyvinyltransferase [Treponema sp.]|nr:3-phosphoshikimate 1-carboxyvinyltransferase [Treponema sp.]